MDQKVCFSLAKKDQLQRTHKQKMNFEGFTQNVCYGNQSRPFEVVFYSTDANTFCFYKTRFDCQTSTSCKFLWNEPKFWQLTLASSAFYSPFLEITSFHITPIGHIIPCHVTEVKLLRFFGLYHCNSINL